MATPPDGLDPPAPRDGVQPVLPIRVSVRDAVRRHRTLGGRRLGAPTPRPRGPDPSRGGAMRRLRILTWHVHGSYLDSLVQTGHDFFLPVAADGSGGRGDWGWPDTVHEVPSEAVRDLDVDLVLFQSEANWREGSLILSDDQLRGPRIYVEHDPPREHPTDTRHPVDDPDVLLVHVTAFNDLMWDSGRTPTRVIEHGVSVPDDVRYSGELERGIVVVNNLRKRGRRLGRDVYERARETIPLDLVGMAAESLGGLGEVKRDVLPAFEARDRKSTRLNSSHTVISYAVFCL